MAMPMSPSLRSALKRKGSWRTLPGLLLIAFFTFLGLWQLFLTFHARDDLGERRTTLQKGFQFATGNSEVEMLLEDSIEKVVSGQVLPKESMILKLQRLLEELTRKSQDSSSGGSSGSDIADDNFFRSKSSNEDSISRNPERDSLVKQLEAVLAEKFRATAEQFQHKLEALKSENEKLKGQFVSHLVETSTWKSLKDLSKFSVLGFLSDLPDRGKTQGPPQLYEFPSAQSNGRHLCILGNNTSNGTRNFYTYAWEDALPSDHIFLEGITLISETEYDFVNPWHSMYNLVQFVYWKKSNACAYADRLLLYHWSELRRYLGGWMTEVFTAADLPVVPYQMEVGDRPVCFQKAVVSRTGIGGVPQTGLQEIFTDMRCLVRRYCDVPVTSFERSKKQRVRITLMVRSGTRAWKNQTEWEAVIADECARIEGCEWSTMQVSNLTFCEQAAVMSRTDVLVSVHGAQLTNMVFMSPGGRVLEMFPKGWLELAGGGQFIYKQLAKWVGLHHEGYWRDLDHADCPYVNDNSRCMRHYKDLPVGINVTHVSTWLRDVITDFKAMQLVNMTKIDYQADSDKCACMGNQR